MTEVAMVHVDLRLLKSMDETMHAKEEGTTLS